MKKVLFIASLALALIACQPAAEQAAKVYGRYVPERKDDFAWENEYAAFRLYGPALLPENPSNGVDLWLKSSPELRIDSMYYHELELGEPYHINYGKGLDCYKVAHTVGCGGLAVVAEDVLYVGGPYSRWEILEQTPDRFSFRLHYDSLLVCNQVMQASLTITAEAGKLLNRADIVITNRTRILLPQLYVGGPYSRWEILEQTPDRFSFRLQYDSLLVCNQVMQASLTITAEAGKLLNRADIVITNRTRILLPQLYVGGGIYLHDTVDNIMQCQCGAVAYAEDALSDKGAAKMNFDYNGSTSQGRNYVAVITPNATRQEIIDGSLLSLKEYQLGDTLTYYFGGCWSEWSNGEQTMATDEDWFNAVRAFAKTL